MESSETINDSKFLQCSKNTMIDGKAVKPLIVNILKYSNSEDAL